MDIKIKSKQFWILFLTAVLGMLLGVFWEKDLLPLPLISEVSEEDLKQIQEYKNATIARVMVEKSNAFQNCYFTYLSRNPLVKEGAVDLLLEIKRSGEISEIEIVRNNFSDSAFDACILKEAQSLKFNPPPRKMNRNILHTLNFKSEKTAVKELKEESGVRLHNIVIENSNK